MALKLSAPDGVKVSNCCEKVAAVAAALAAAVTAVSIPLNMSLVLLEFILTSYMST
jgi:hypothetical protein